MDRRTFIRRTALWALGLCLGEYAFQRFPASASPPRIAIIIDDIGYHLRQALPFLEMDIPLTFSVLPRLKHSAAASAYIHRCRHQVMLHQPMEPLNAAIDPGPGALFVGDDPSRIRRTIDGNLRDVPHADGINNHMGSRFTAQHREMATAVDAMKQHRLFFVDSLTSNRSVGYRQAVRHNLTAACRNIFLDHHRRTAAISAQLARLKTHALIHGRAIAIGHPYPQTAIALRRFLRDQDHSDVCFVHVSQVL